MRNVSRLSFEKLCAFHGFSVRCDITGCCGGLVFSSRIQFFGLESILGGILVGRGWRVLTFWRSMGGSPRQTTQYPIQWNEKN